MTALTRRRRDHGLHREAWDIHWGDVRVGTIGQVNGTEGRMIWQWTCGFHPGCEPRERTRGTCVTFDEARAAFERQWRLLQPRVTDEMMDEWRRNEAWTAWKYLMWDRGCLMPAQTTNGFSHCFCGAEITTKSVPDHVYSEHMDRSKRQLEWEH